MNKKVSVVVPCLNEHRTLPTVIDNIRELFRLLGDDLEKEIVIADNGSTDGSPDLAKSLGCRVVPVARKGYGSALMGGIAAVGGGGG